MFFVLFLRLARLHLYMYDVHANSCFDVCKQILAAQQKEAKNRKKAKIKTISYGVCGIEK